MDIKFVSMPETMVAIFDGELDECSAEYSRKKLDTAIEMTTVSNFIFDFKKLKFMDSTGIGVLLGRYKKLKSKNIILWISGANCHIDKILNMAGIYTIIKKIS